jgi:protein gp37
MHCYAERMSKRLAGRYGYPADEPFKVTLHPEKLEEPLRWRKPQMVFVCSMGDLFHEDVPDDYIDRVFAVMALCPQHVFQLLTKRPERMRAWFKRFDAIGESVLGDSPVGAWLNGPYGSLLDLARELPGGNENWRQIPPEYEDGHCINRGYWFWIGDEPMQKIIPWPLPNLWLGVTAEDQRRADKRIPLLLQTPATVRFVSVEPMLGPVELANSDHNYLEGWETGLEHEYGCPGVGPYCESHCPVSVQVQTPKIDWVIVGGETGPGARPIHPDWARGLRDQCQAAGVPFFFKSWGEWAQIPHIYISDSDIGLSVNGDRHGYCSIHDKNCATMRRVGKKAAGRLLDGVGYSEMPERGAV